MKREKYTADKHQEVAIDWLKKNKRAGLFLGMSLGKTAVVATAINYLIHEELAFTCALVVAPKRVAGISWNDELSRWEHLKDLSFVVVDGTEEERLAKLRKPANVYLIGNAQIAWLEKLYQRKKTSRGLPSFGAIVIDESSVFKNISSKRFLALERLKKLHAVDYRYILTGTPEPNGLIDLYAQIKFLDDGLRLGTTRGEYVRKYFTTRGNGSIVYEYIPLEGAAKKIASKISDIVLSMQTRDFLKLPEVIEKDCLLEFEPFDRELYDELEKEYVLQVFDEAKKQAKIKAAKIKNKKRRKAAEEAWNVTAANAATLGGKLLQITSGAIYDDNKVVRELNSLKLDTIERLIREREGNIIIVYYYKHELKRLCERFPTARVLNKKADVDAWNRGEIKILLLHPASAGHGLNLQFGGACEIWSTPTWNSEHYEQTVARIQRRGQPHAVEIIRLIVKGTRDARVIKAVKKKTSNQSFFMSEITNLRKKYNA